MKRLIMLATVVVTLTAFSSGVRAAGEQTVSAEKPARTGFFSKLMELERRKNAAILRFLGFKK